MQDNSILFYEVTSRGEQVKIEKPIYESIINAVLYGFVGENAEPVTRYGVDYHVAWRERWECEPNVTLETQEWLSFEGRQGDFFYCLKLKNKEAISDLEVEVDKVIDLINSDVWDFDIKCWAFNDAEITDDPGICQKEGKLTYEIKLTDLISVAITVQSEQICDDFLDKMNEFERLVRSGKFELRAQKRM